MSDVSVGVDIGGTKCALSIGDCTTDSVKILHREEFPTAGLAWQTVLESFCQRIDAYFAGAAHRIARSIVSSPRG